MEIIRHFSNILSVFCASDCTRCDIPLSWRMSLLRLEVHKTAIHNLYQFEVSNRINFHVLAWWFLVAVEMEKARSEQHGGTCLIVLILNSILLYQLKWYADELVSKYRLGMCDIFEIECVYKSWSNNKQTHCLCTLLYFSIGIVSMVVMTVLFSSFLFFSFHSLSFSLFRKILLSFNAEIFGLVLFWIYSAQLRFSLRFV